MNETLKTLIERRSCRNYTAELPQKELLEEVIKAGTFAATGRGKQSPIILAVTDKETRDMLSKVNAEILGVDTDPFYGAPAVLVVLADKSFPTYLYDGSLVMGNLMNAAHAVGLASCWINRAKETFLRPEGKALLEKLGITGDYEGIGNCIIGYAAQPPMPAAPRKDNYVYYIR